ncbi:CD209 antigen-like protein E isoform X9 [Etheostoma cragini]|uniref:CD209 antigen-like protein E isoform X9 n=1 Tax=Etheostoma cragini TaxID=417921 RepID=UPI00155E66B1|nr:CD209 antigen-like protein E isoform X9 [Etheostoma cragini]
MSADAVAAPRLSLNVRYNRNVQETSGEEEESQLEILEEEEHHADLRPQRAGPHTQNKPAANNRRRLKAAAVTLGGFYLLILAALFIRYTLLQTRYDQLRNNNTQLQDEVKQLKDRTEVTLLQTRYDQLSNNYTQLQDEVKQLKDRIEVLKVCHDGWTRFGCSCYFKSKEKKDWGDSRDDSEKRGADLVVIDNKEEQKFVSELSNGGESWIGLRYDGKEWRWVDGSPLTETFWGPGLPRYGRNQPRNWSWYPVACCDQQGKWTQSYHSDYKTWICEKKII